MAASGDLGLPSRAAAGRTRQDVARAVDVSAELVLELDLVCFIQVLADPDRPALVLLEEDTDQLIIRWRIACAYAGL
jgi:hypothetical protein